MKYLLKTRVISPFKWSLVGAVALASGFALEGVLFAFRHIAPVSEMLGKGAYGQARGKVDGVFSELLVDLVRGFIELDDAVRFQGVVKERELDVLVRAVKGKFL